jgi:hypothetical protein
MDRPVKPGEGEMLVVVSNENGRDKPGHDDDCNERGYQSFARST